MNIGIFGGSFNPIHKGHLAIARHMIKQQWLEQVWFMVTPLNPFKASATNLLPDEQRLELVREAIKGDKQLIASDFEFHLPKPSYTWDTLQALSEAYPEHQFSLIIGADNWAAWNLWYHADDILHHYPIYIYPRTGFPVDESTLPPSVHFVHMRRVNISATDIRKAAKNGGFIEKFVPKSIAAKVAEYYRKEP